MNKPMPQADITGGAARRRRPASPFRRAWRTVDRWIVVTHRWLGILTCIAAAIWCLSGIAIMYVVQPKLTELERHAGLSPISWHQVMIGPTEALKAAGQDRFPQEISLEMQGARPVYQIVDWKGGYHPVSAVDGKPIANLSRAEAMAIARAFAGSNKPSLIAPVADDLWTFKAAFDKTRPFYKIALNDAAGRQIYVSARSGVIAMESNRFDRVITFVGRFPHIFETPWMRPHPLAYRQIMLWATGLATLVGLGGMVLGVVRLSLVKRYGGGSITPFRGWMKWHHILGLIGGLTLCVWTATAYIYMKPNHIFPEDGFSPRQMQAYAGHDRADFPVAAADLAALAPLNAGAAGMAWVAGRPLVFFNDARSRFTTFDGAARPPARISDARLTEAARLLVPGAPVVRTSFHDTTDRYWHTFKGNYKKLPMFRVEFGDRDHTWLHLDPTTGKLMGKMTDSERGYYLFFNEIHKADIYGFTGPWRKAVLWALMLAGTAICITGAVVGWKHMTRPVRRRRNVGPKTPVAAAEKG